MNKFTKFLLVIPVIGIMYAVGLFNVLGFFLTTQTGVPTGSCGYGYGYDGSTYGYGTVTCSNPVDGGTYIPYQPIDTQPSNNTTTTSSQINTIDGQGGSTTFPTTPVGNQLTALDSLITPAQIDTLASQSSKIKNPFRLPNTGVEY